MKKVWTLLLVAILCLSTGNVAHASSPSGWAKEEVNKAIKETLVMSGLQGDYQSKIKRYQYVLLAVSVLDKKGVKVEITEPKPFTDTAGHPFETQIIKAYNAGIISGYGNGLFRPNNYIKREEIASLVYKLDQKIGVDPSNNLAYEVEYADKGTIAGWAKHYVDYCYSNNIMKGVGSNKSGKPVISPKGTATREQAIILLYRMAKAAQLVEIGEFGNLSYNRTYVNEEDQEMTVTVTTDVLKDVAKSFNNQTVLKIQKFIGNDIVKVKTISKDFVILEVQNTAEIQLENLGYGMEARLFLEDTTKTDILHVYSELTNALTGSDEYTSEVERGTAVLAFHPEEIYRVEMENGEFSVEITNDEEKKLRYYRSYIKK